MLEPRGPKALHLLLLQGVVMFLNYFTYSFVDGNEHDADMAKILQRSTTISFTESSSNHRAFIFSLSVAIAFTRRSGAGGMMMSIQYCVAVRNRRTGAVLDRSCCFPTHRGSFQRQFRMRQTVGSRAP